MTFKFIFGPMKYVFYTWRKTKAKSLWKWISSKHMVWFEKALKGFDVSKNIESLFVLNANMKIWKRAHLINF